MSAVPSSPRVETPLDWAAIFGGTVLAAGVSFTLIAFGSAIGLSVASTSPAWRNSSAVMWILSGLFLVFIALCSFGAGGYMTGRMRNPDPSEDVDFTSGMHGLVTWGLSILAAGLLAIVGAVMVSNVASSSSGAGVASVAGESMVASELDDLFRTYRALPDQNIPYRRAEAARILLKSGSPQGVSPDDREYLATIVRLRAGVAQPDAADRVNRIVASTTSDIHRARVAVVLQAFLVAAASFLGAAVAWFAAVEGGRERAGLRSASFRTPWHHEAQRPSRAP